MSDPRKRSGVAVNETTRRTLRVPGPLWNACMAKAHAEGRTLTDVVIELLTHWATEEN